MWAGSRVYRRLHSQLTVLWAAGLLIESGIGFAVVYTLSFDAAVVLTRLLGPATLITLSAWTTHQDAACTRQAAGPSPSAAAVS